MREGKTEAAPSSLSPGRADLLILARAWQGQGVGCLHFQKTEHLLCDRQHCKCFLYIYHLI